MAKKAKAKTEDGEKSSIAESLRSRFVKQFGADQVGDNSPTAQLFIKTGIMVLDNALVGGIPRGKITEVFGDSSSGKSLVGLLVGIEAQKMGGYFVYIDAEYSLDIPRAVNLGLDTDENKFFMLWPDTLEQAWEMIQGAVETIRSVDQENVIFVFFDSLSGVTTKEACEKTAEQKTMGDEAKLNSREFKKIIPKIFKQDVALMVVSQVRDKIGVMFGPKTTTAGGRSAEYYSSVRIKAKKSSDIYEGEKEKQQVIGQSGILYVSKNRLAPYGKSIPFIINQKTGIDFHAGLFDFCLKQGKLKPAITEATGKPRAGYYRADGFDYTITQNTFYDLLDGDKKFFQYMIESDVHDMEVEDVEEHV